MKKFFMKLLIFFCFLWSGFCFYVFFNIIFVKHNYDFMNWIFLFINGPSTLLFFWFLVSEDFWLLVSEEKEPEETPTVTNIDKPKVEEPKEDEIISVTEIKGTRKIIKNGKVIYCEQLKADELQVYEKLKDKN